MKTKWNLLLLPIVLLITSCSSSDTGSASQQIDYDQTKKMVVDILKTDDGKKAIQDVMSDDKMKEKLVMDQKVVSQTIQQTLASDKASEFWKKTFSDPKFAQSVAKNMQAENEKLLKTLMNDPSYRNMMIQVFKEPEIQKELTDALKSKDYRQHLQSVITETVDSPLFRAKIQELLLKAAEETKAKSGGSSQSSNKSSGST
ncbi:spore gernimation protein GerD [Bacillus sp. BRMEA1]|uniref:spore germination lipoprotein GerD n=1 Tax=Neobacillus endophyticus TaxID=2738405 RepID=UPI0015631A85|nr:spore germination lipoprotein GerD [Neobacillus endophyticus]NRD77571.1 spore gernimation protein GerD [Neobacillus endophyticus]